jgi:S-formylglutathione hydrolase
MAIDILAEHRCHGGVQGFYRHTSTHCQGPMRFGLFAPPNPRGAPLLFCLAGLTCSEETFAIKAGAQRVAAELGLMLLMPDTSPRETGFDGATGDWTFGEGAGFWLDATAAPWRQRFRLASWIKDELRAIAAQFGADLGRCGLLGHSMGGHGALTLGLKHPDLFRSVSAFAPIVAPTQVPWGQALSRYLGNDPGAWAQHDACALLDAGYRCAPLRVDQGRKDKFLADQLQPERLQAACDAAGQPLDLRFHDGYDHGYFFIQSFVDEHLRFHAQALR